ncbi:MAG: hypothetical protein AAF456_11495 [Planctomycetota bacterium]
MLNRRFSVTSFFLAPALLVVLACLSVWLLTQTPSNAESPPNSELPATDLMVVHEWGTFTELQNEAGVSLTGINTDDEPVPHFVHGFGNRVLSPTVFPEQFFGKRLPYRHWQVATRLETPVIYFYPPDGAELPVKLNVEVGLREGWLSEYYPQATVEAPGLNELSIRDNEYSRLIWENLLVGTEGRYPETQDPVWLNPRSTQSAGVTNAAGESEKYLFYRGVGKFSGPLRIQLDRELGQLSFATVESTLPESPDARTAWLVDVQRDGSVAFRRIHQNQSGTVDGVTTGYRFTEEEFSQDNLQLLKDQMHEALVADGLFVDEASAMLATWNNAYFRSPGLRVFYLVPRDWTDDQMPLSISVPTHVERVMVGRIELISDENHELLQQIRSTPASSREWLSQITNEEAGNRMFAGHSDFGDLGVEIPEDYQRYLDLGRFRNAMLRAEFIARPDENLQKFLTQYGLNPPSIYSFGSSDTDE